MATRDPEDRRASADMAETAEFKAAVDAAVAAALPALLVQLAAAREAAGSRSEAGDGDFAKALALEIAKISGQGSGKIYVDPVVLEWRDKKMAELKTLLVELRAQNEVPVYRLIGKVQLPIGSLGPVMIDPLYRDRQKVQHNTELDWPGMPNLMMQPVNEPARRVMTLFREAVGEELPHGEEDLGAIALSPTGAVVRGAAAEMILRNSRQAAQPEVGAAQGEVAQIRRGDDPVKRKVQVLGTLTAPIEVQ